MPNGLLGGIGDYFSTAGQGVQDIYGGMGQNFQDAGQYMQKNPAFTQGLLTAGIGGLSGLSGIQSLGLGGQAYGQAQQGILSGKQQGFDNQIEMLKLLDDIEPYSITKAEIGTGSEEDPQHLGERVFVLPPELAGILGTRYGRIREKQPFIQQFM